MLLAKPWRFIIYTPEKSGNLSIGEKQNFSKINFKKNKKSLNTRKLKPKTHNLFSHTFTLFLVGFLLMFYQNGDLLLNIGEAQAAINLPTNITLPQNVARSISPLVESLQPPVQPVTAPLTSTDGYLPKPLVAETQVTKKSSMLQKPTSVKKAVTISKMNLKIQSDTEIVANRFAFGYCTYYVAGRRFIPWSGNAITWLTGARNFGYATGNTPQVGAIVVTNEGGSAGHVAYIDAVDGDQITISEMNYRGFGVISSRTISASYGRILGYIY